MRRSSTPAAGRPTSSRSAREPKGRRSRNCASAWRSKAISTRARGDAALAWDADLTAAVKHFQSRMGLRQTGVVAGATLKAINVPASGALQRTGVERATAGRAQFSVRRPLCRRSTCPRPRSRRSRTAASLIAMSRSSAIPNILRRRSPRISRSSTSIRPGRCRPRSSRKRSSRACSAIRAISTRAKIRILDGSGQEINPKSRRLEHRTRGQLHAAPGFGRRQFARLDPHRHAQQARGLYARHAVEGAVRRRLSLPQPRLRARAGRLRLRRMAAAGTGGGPGGVWDKAALHAKIKEGAREDIRLAQGGAGDLGLPDRLGERRRPGRISATTSTASTRSARRAGERRRAARPRAMSPAQ